MKRQTYLDAEGAGREILKFWDNRGKRFQEQEDLVNASNLEADTVLAKHKHTSEKEVLMRYIQPKSSDSLLDLGAGHCAWAVEMARAVCKVDAVEFSSSMIKLAERHLKDTDVKNIVLHHCAAQEYRVQKSYDVVLISGLTIYLNDEAAIKMIKNLSNMTTDRSRIILRDATGRYEEFNLEMKYSRDLMDHYTAHYRTRDQYKELFEANGFRLVCDQDMFASESNLNKRKETVLRIYKFEKSPGK